MSLTNEQRAHDLAIASLEIMYDQEKTKLLSLAKNESRRGNDITVDIEFDPYIEYQKLYGLILKEINKDF
ncbi:hypothetical protein [Enterococcus entomosocium]|uniref:hypothetical protein n=1 Tax=Enterococcus entomosocium TaxID=3034352 RepID=UPI002647DEDD|nr:hypothetical protein [Enterococcus entomosocium]